MAANIDIGWVLRPAIYRPRVNRPNLNIVKDTEVHCHVWGCYQVDDGEGDVNPYFIVELQDGRCTYVAPEDIQFTDVCKPNDGGQVECT